MVQMIHAYGGVHPQIEKSVFIAPGAFIIGDVHVERDTGIWFQVTVRGDINFIKIGRETNIQDHSILHVTGKDFPLTIGNQVTVGHGCILHGCRINDLVLVGMGAIILDGAEIGSLSMVAAGSLVKEGEKFPGGVLVAGSPAKIKRDLSPAEKEKIRISAEHYVIYKNTYMKNFHYLEEEK